MSKKPLPPEFRPIGDPRYEIQNEEIQRKLRELGVFINEQMPEGWGFTLLLYDFGEKTGLPGRDAMFYLSSGNREDVILSMKEFIKKQEH